MRMKDHIVHDCISEVMIPYLNLCVSSKQSTSIHEERNEKILNSLKWEGEELKDGYVLVNGGGGIVDSRVWMLKFIRTMLGIVLRNSFLALNRDK